MKKTIFLGMCAFLMAFSLFAQNGERKQLPTADRAKNSVDKIARTVPLTEQQKADMTSIFVKFYDDVRAQQAFRDQDKMSSLEKDRDGKVEKLLKNPKTYKQYLEAVKMLKAEMQQRQHQH